MPKRIRPRVDCDKCCVSVAINEWSRHCKSKKHQGVKRTYECSKCDYVAKNGRSLYSHVQWKHRTVNKRTWLYGCVVCEIRIKDTTHIKAHVCSRNHLKKLAAAKLPDNAEVMIRDRLEIVTPL